MRSIIKKEYRRLKRWISDPVYRSNLASKKEDLQKTIQLNPWIKNIPPQESESLLILSFTDLPLHAKFHCLIGRLFQLKKYQVYALNYTGNRFGNKYFDWFGIRVICWNEWVKKITPTSEEIENLIEELLPEHLTGPNILPLAYKQVAVGKHALSVTCRKLVEGNLNFQDSATRLLFLSYFKEAVVAVIAAEKLLHDYPIKKVLVRDAGYIPNGAIFETAMYQGLDTIVYEQGQKTGTWIFKRYTLENYGEHYFSIDKERWSELQHSEWTPEMDQELDQLFTERYLPDSTTDTRRLHSGKRIKSREEVQTILGLDPNKPTAVIFSHIAWDAAFFFGSCLFDDFEDWLYQTVEYAAKNCPEVNWIVKLHPFNAFKLQREDKTEESEMRLLRNLMPLPDHIKIMRSDTEINTKSLFQVINYVLTVNGTVGMEFPCFGIPSILAGTGRYNGRGFTIEPPTKEAYFKQLSTLHHIPALKADQVRLARMHFYHLIHDRQYDLSEVLPMKLLKANEAQSDVHDNVDYQLKSNEELKSIHTTSKLQEWLLNSKSADLFQSN